MAQILQKTKPLAKGNKLFLKNLPFRIVFEVKLDNGFEIKDMTYKHVQEFHRFIHETIYKI